MRKLVCIHWIWISDIWQSKITRPWGSDSKSSWLCCRGGDPVVGCRQVGSGLGPLSALMTIAPSPFDMCLGCTYWKNKATQSMNLCWRIQRGLEVFHHKLNTSQQSFWRSSRGPRVSFSLGIYSNSYSSFGVSLQNNLAIDRVFKLMVKEAFQLVCFISSALTSCSSPLPPPPPPPPRGAPISLRRSWPSSGTFTLPASSSLLMLVPTSLVIFRLQNFQTRYHWTDLIPCAS